MNFDKLLHGVITQVINPVIMLLSTTAFIVFIWGVVTFIRDGGDSTKRADAQRAILWSLIGLVIIFGTYGILNVATATFGFGTVHPITTP
ncbi:hypothetical protein MNBD_CPR01-396 [hydrothermal vent metagenome]|uniref:Uncharacterized protein n=1 Tax=hydrothermal vent metagenome TaxID=652676 RepID=A0A3B0V5D8_9ZZZZ